MVEVMARRWTSTGRTAVLMHVTMPRTTDKFGGMVAAA
jgi:hypothetical protein